MRSFRDALNIVLAEITPQPWDYTASDGATLTVIPAGLREDPGKAEVYVRVTASKTEAAQAAITTTDLPNLIAALEQRTEWRHEPRWGTDTLTLTHDDGGPTVAVTEDDYRDGVWHTASASMVLPVGQRMPLASALGRALEVAHAWEDDA